ncbi:hypothetical protein EVAR_65259_1 [Eumeta japonica]|uniref:Uncharacterized protein n=1 Tax=Eumeta variegata TaxID=151549 RepID=A0A4C1ZWH5_EUMVA|nr:hypothetical protein EVAR_65259_1 [Eumeta japonica]
MFGIEAVAVFVVGPCSGQLGCGTKWAGSRFGEIPPHRIYVRSGSFRSYVSFSNKVCRRVDMTQTLKPNPTIFHDIRLTSSALKSSFWSNEDRGQPMTVAMMQRRHRKPACSHILRRME